MKLFPHTKRRYLDAVEDHVVVFDGSMGVTLLAKNLTAEDYGGQQYFGCVDYLAISRPDIIEFVHRSFLEVGAEVVETDTFRANRITMKEYGLQERVVEINRTAAQIARRVAERFARETGVPRFVAGSIGPSGLLPSSDDRSLGNITFAQLRDVFREQALGLILGGADLLIIETQQDILETKAAIHGAWRAFEEMGIRIPIQAQVTLDTTGRMLLGTDIAAALTTLEALPVVDVIGLNCSTGPDYMREPVRYLTQHARKPISVIPNAGLPLNVDGREVYPMKPVPIAEILAEFVIDLGVNVVGGCCGTTPEHIREVVARVGGRKPKRTPIQPPSPTLPPPPRTRGRPSEQAPTGEGSLLPPLSAQSADGGGSGWGFIEYTPMISSAMRAIPLHQDPPPLIVGERVNSQGSRKVKKLLLEDKYDDILTIARDQVEGGAHTLDVCVALTERPDEAEQMRQLVKKLQMSVEAPLFIDSTEADVIKAALEMNPGRAVINSINLERGRERCDAVLPLAVAHGSAVIALTIDERGMAKTADAKLEVAKRIYDIAVNEYALSPDSLIFDTLTFTLATGDAEMANSAIETMEGIRQIKAELPGALASLGVSNVSFGLAPAARAALNSVFLYHCVQAGLDMALVHPKDITPYAELDPPVRQLCDDLIYNRAPDALTQFIAHFENVKATSDKAEDPTKDMTPEQKIHWMILHRKKDGIEPLIDISIDAHGVAHGDTPNDGAVWTLNNVLLPAMKEVGDKFGAGELILPFVLQSAEVMKKAVAHLEKYLDKKEGQTKGRVVLATVYGDVHDIGKSLVNTILTNNGYTVFDLGKQVPANVIIDKALEVNATAIGLSALLVSTSKQMPLIVNELNRRGLQFPVLIGGAAINRKFGRRILFTESGKPYEPGVFYCKDAFEGLESMEKLIDPNERGDFVGRIIADAYEEGGKPKPTTDRRRQTAEVSRPSAVRRLPSNEVPKPPFWGSRVIRAMPLEIVLKNLDLNELYRLQWGAKNAHGDEWARLKAEFEARLDRMTREMIRTRLLEPQGVYGYFPANSDGDTLIVYDPQDLSGLGDLTGLRNGNRPHTELARFTFPRQRDYERLCIADYFAPVDSGIVDVAAFQVVTVGPAADEQFEELQARGEYSEAFFLHGLSVEAAEATAEYVHQHIRRELNIAPEQGRRYSWGYPACPDLSQHALVFKLLPQTSELGISLTSAFQLVPEQSTAAIIAHHPEAKYYSMKMSRLEQLEAEMASSAVS